MGLVNLSAQLNWICVELHANLGNVSLFQGEVRWNSEGPRQALLWVSFWFRLNLTLKVKLRSYEPLANSGAKGGFWEQSLHAESAEPTELPGTPACPARASEENRTCKGFLWRFRKTLQTSDLLVVHIFRQTPDCQAEEASQDLRHAPELGQKASWLMAQFKVKMHVRPVTWAVDHGDIKYEVIHNNLLFVRWITGKKILSLKATT